MEPRKRPQTAKTTIRPFSATTNKRPTTQQLPKRSSHHTQSAKKLPISQQLTPHHQHMPKIVKSARQLRIPMPSISNIDISSKHWDIISQQTHQQMARQMPIKPPQPGGMKRPSSEYYEHKQSQNKSSKGLLPSEDQENEQYPHLDFLQYKPFKFWENVGGKQTSSMMLTPKIQMDTPKQDPSESIMDNSEYVNIQAKIGPQSRQTLTIFMNSKVDEYRNIQDQPKPKTAMPGYRVTSAKGTRKKPPQSAGTKRPITKPPLSQRPETAQIKGRVQIVSPRQRPESAKQPQLSRPFSGKPPRNIPQKQQLQFFEGEGLDLRDPYEVKETEPDIMEEECPESEFPNFEEFAHKQGKVAKSSQEILGSRPTTATIFKKESEIELPFPDIFDRSERTFAATFAKFGDLSFYSPVQRIGAYIDFMSRLKKRHLMDIIHYRKTSNKTIKAKSDLESGEERKQEYFDNCLFHGFMKEENPAPENEAAKDQFQLIAKEFEEKPLYDPGNLKLPECEVFSKLWSEASLHQMEVYISRYIKYIHSDEIKTDELSKYKKRWMTNALDLIGNDELLRSFEEVVRKLYQEIFDNYFYAMKKAIIDYILLCPSERKRLHILALPRPIPVSSDIGIFSGGYSVEKYSTWHDDYKRAKEEIKLRLLTNNIVMSSLSNWFYDFRWFKLVHLKGMKAFSKGGNCLTLDIFLQIVKNYRKKVKGVFKHLWHRGAILLIKKFKFLKKRGTSYGRFTFYGFNELEKEQTQMEETREAFKSGIGTFTNTMMTSTMRGMQDETTFNSQTLSEFNDFAYGYQACMRNQVKVIGLDDLMDIRENPAYVGFVSLIGGFINFSDDGYKILAKEYKTEIKYSAGNLMQIQLRQVIDRTVQMMYDFFFSFSTMKQIIKEEKLKTRSKSKFGGIPAAPSIVRTRKTRIVQGSGDYTNKEKERERKDSSQEISSRSRKESIKTRSTILEEENSRRVEERRPSQSVVLEEADMESRIIYGDFMNYQHLLSPCFRINLLVNKFNLQFSEETSTVLENFGELFDKVVTSFNHFIRPEFASIELVDTETLEKEQEEEKKNERYHMSTLRRNAAKDNSTLLKDCNPGVYKKYYGNIRIVEKPKEVIELDQDRNLKIFTNTVLQKYMNVASPFEDTYVEIKQKILKKIANHLEEAQEIFDIFTPLEDLINGKLVKEVEAFCMKQDKIDRKTERDRIINEYNAKIKEIRRIERLCRRIPYTVSFSMFEVGCDLAREELLKRAKGLKDQIIRKLEMDVIEKSKEICQKFEDIVGELKKSVFTAHDVMEMDSFKNTLVLERVQLQDKMYENRKNLFYLIDIDHCLNEETIDLTKDIHIWPGRLEKFIDEADDRHRNERADIEEKLRIRREKLEDTIDVMFDSMKEIHNFTEILNYDQNMTKIEEYAQQLAECEEELNEISDEEMMLFGFRNSFDTFVKMKLMFTPHYDLWKSIYNFKEQKQTWYHSNVKDIDATDVDVLMKSSLRTLQKVSKLIGKKAEVLCKQFKNEIGELAKNLPTIEKLCIKGLRDRHWEKIQELLGGKFDWTTITLSDIIKRDAINYLTQIGEISDTALKEFTIENNLNKMQDEWKGLEIGVVNWRDTEIPILHGSELEEIQLKLDEHTINAQTIRANPYVKPIEDRAIEWERYLLFVQELLDVWVKVQSNFLYLKPIFNSQDINHKLPSESVDFSLVDKNWKELMDTLQEDRKILNIERIPGLLENLSSADIALEKIQKKLNDYLNSKRAKFPRFYFLSNEELLEILGETQNPLKVQRHLKKIFEGINELVFNYSVEITGMKSVENEHIPFLNKITPLTFHGNVEEWLTEVEKEMRAAISEKMDRSVEAYYSAKKRVDWVLKWPGQVILCVSQIFWCDRITKALEEKSVKMLEVYLKECDLMLGNIVELVRGELSELDRITLGALVVIDVHKKDVLTYQLIQNNITSPTAFEWQSQLRYYYHANYKSVSVEMITTKLQYAMEYLGNSSRLVITPLTDRCYRTLMGALKLNLGGAPEGPAGTGKTETVKDLAKAVATKCVVFNCSEGLDYTAMAKFFKGLASAGAWSCFDEFNRIDLEVLSVVASQILQIQTAKSERKVVFRFEGENITLKQECNIFITMNPGYAGRTELPDNLKALFRPVAMMVPDYAMIAEISLYSFGFSDARNMARKIVATYKLCSEQLSSQYHYDYGMRAVKAVLTTSGALKMRNIDWKEDALVLRSITDVNLPKFLSDDIELFKNITSDLFPNVTLPNTNYGELDECIQNAILEQNLQSITAFREKIIQLYEMINCRHGLMLVGESFGGKSTCYKVLASALISLAQKYPEIAKELGVLPVEHFVIFPKSVTLFQLYGYFDPVSHDWSDGVLAFIFRQCSVKNVGITHKWIVFDGPVDAIWIESMNTVLDDNKMLCLMNGEIIQMPPKMNLIYEVADLSQASPATVSRCGMVYMEPNVIGWWPLLKSWIQLLPSQMDMNLKRHIEDLFDAFISPCYQYIHKRCKLYIPIGEIHAAVNLMKIMELFLSDSRFIEQCESSRVKQEEIINKIDMHFIFSLVWSVGAITDEQGMKTFSQFFRKLCAEPLCGPNRKDRKPFRVEKNCHIPESSGIVHNYYLENYRWRSWKERMERMEREEGLGIDESLPTHEIVIPTIETMKYKFVIDLFLQNGISPLLLGPTGTGKSVYINNYLKGLEKDKFHSIFICFSAQTSANQTQDIIDLKLERRRKRIYGPPLGKKCFIFVDDLNMPEPEKFGAQPPIELLRQFMDQGGWYDRKEKERAFKQLVDIVFISAMGPPSGGRNPVTNRYIRHYNLITINNFDESVMLRIFTYVTNIYNKRNNVDLPSARIFSNIVQATITLYQSITENLRPTPAKSHYLFNLRDVSRVFQGIQLISPQSTPLNPKMLVRLWVHEICRVFYDRLATEEDQKWLYNSLFKVCRDHIREDLKTVLEDIINFEEVDINSSDTLRYICFGDVMGDGISSYDRPYEEIVNKHHLQEKVCGFLEEYNSSQINMNLVMFDFAVEHVLRICRVLRMAKGNALLIGVGGSGRQSLTLLSTFMCEFQMFRVELTRNYNLDNWREDMKNLLRKTVLEEKYYVFFLSDNQIKFDFILEDINNLLNSGEIPNLYAPDEKVEISEKLRSIAKKENRLNIFTHGSPEQVYDFFIEKVRSNLSIVLAMSPIGSTLRNNIRMFPSLVNCCTINWFTDWPAAALTAVADNFLGDIELPEETKAIITELCKSFHEEMISVSKHYREEEKRHTYVTPTSYLELLMTYKCLLGQRRDKILGQKQGYDKGIEKLISTSHEVEKLQEQLNEKEPILKEMTIEAQNLMEHINKEKTEVVEPQKKIILEEEQIANEHAEKAAMIKDECTKDLAQCQPILKEAIVALDTIKENDIIEIKTFKKPPNVVKKILHAVCVMNQVPPIYTPKADNPREKEPNYWETGKKFLSQKGLIESLKNFDKDHIPENIIKIIREKFLSDPEFDAKRAAKASIAAKGLCVWIRALNEYCKVLKIVNPKREKARIAKEEYKVTITGLRKKQEELRIIIEKLDELQHKLEETERKKKQLDEEIEDCKVRIQRATILLEGLGGERQRWIEASENLSLQNENLAGDILLSSATISYLGTFISKYRISTLRKWIVQCQEFDLKVAYNFTLENTMGEPVTIRKWNLNGLPTDSFSKENAIISSLSRRYPLMIDPQGQANRWLKNLEHDNNLIVVKLIDHNYLREIKRAVQYGQPLILENVGEELDPSLDGLLLKQTFLHGGLLSIKLGDETIDYSKDFRMYITTKMQNPHYLPELSTKVTLINFMITYDGLRDQLLDLVVQKEKPELEEQRSKLILESYENKKNLKECEERILETLREVKGNILSDESAINVLNESQTLAKEVQEKERISEETEKRIEESRTEYSPIASHSSMLFFIIANLSQIEVMYQYSLNWFINLFTFSIDNSEPSDYVEERIQILREYFTYSFYQNICRSLFQKDKLLFSFLLTTTILQSQEQISIPEYKFFIMTHAGLKNPKSLPNPCKEWLSDRDWNVLCSLSSLSKSFEDIDVYFKRFESIWKKFAESPEPHKEEIPKAHKSLNKFQRLCLIKVLAADKLTLGMKDFIVSELGQAYIEPPHFSLEKAFADSIASTPLIFVLPGSDPMASLTHFAQQKHKYDSMKTISLGQGQGIIAEKAIEESKKVGSWVLLQNCHLAPSWMPKLEKIVEGLESKKGKEQIHPSFRLWLTSYPSTHFPVLILQNGIKMTNEPPKGAKANLIGSYMTDPISDPQFFEGHSHPHEFKTLLYGLCFFHCLIQERRNFGPLGWNIPYEFNESDLRISVRQLHILLSDYDVLPFKALTYLAGECNYGGRVTDDRDRRVLHSLLRTFFSHEFLVDNYEIEGLPDFVVPSSEFAHQRYVQHIQNLPGEEPPELFGFNENANITKNLKETKSILQSLLYIGDSIFQSKKQSLTTSDKWEGKVSTDENKIEEMSNEILNKIPDKFDIELAQHKYPVLYANSMNSVLVQELTRFNTLILTIKSSLRNILDALKGKVLMSSQLEQIFNSLLLGKIPEQWMKHSYPSLKPVASYINDLKIRLSFFKDWLDNGAPPIFWISGFFFTQSFLTGTLQNYARKNTIEIDTLSFDFEFLDEDKTDYNKEIMERTSCAMAVPDDGVFISGLYLEGCKWDYETHMLGESDAKVLYSKVPIIWLQPTLSENEKKYNYYECPVYKTTDRRGMLSTTGHSTNFIMMVKVPSNEHPDHWVKRGVAMLCQLSN